MDCMEVARKETLLGLTAMLLYFPLKNPYQCCFEMSILDKCCLTLSQLVNEIITILYEIVESTRWF